MKVKDLRNLLLGFSEDTEVWVDVNINIISGDKLIYQDHCQSEVGITVSGFGDGRQFNEEKGKVIINTFPAIQVNCFIK